MRGLKIMDKTPAIIALGYIFNENIQWPDGRTEGPYLGATGSYGAVALGLLGADAGFVTNIGVDTSYELLSPIYECGIDCTGVNRNAGEFETKNLLVYKEDGKKEIKYLKRAREIAFADIPERYLNAKLFHLCLVDYEVPVETILEIRKINPKALFSVDFGGMGGAHSTPEKREIYINKDNGRMQNEYLKNIDIGKASIEDAEIAFGKNFDEPEAVADEYIKHGVKIVVVTMGEKGAFIKTAYGQKYYIDAVTPFNGLKDTTGAGDTFITAFVCEYIKTGDLVRSGYFASATSSLLIEKTGGVRLDRTPNRSTVEKRLEQFFNGCNGKKALQ